MLRNWCNWFGRHIDRVAPLDRVLAVAFHRDPAAFEDEYLMLVGVRVLGRMSAGRNSNCRMEKLGAASSGPIRQRMRQFAAPSVSTGAASNLLATDDFHGSIPSPRPNTLDSHDDPVYHIRPRRKNPEATTPSAVWASAKEDQPPLTPRS